MHVLVRLFIHYTNHKTRYTFICTSHNSILYIRSLYPGSAKYSTDGNPCMWLTKQLWVNVVRIFSVCRCNKKATLIQNQQPRRHRQQDWSQDYSQHSLEDEFRVRIARALDGVVFCAGEVLFLIAYKYVGNDKWNASVTWRGNKFHTDLSELDWYALNGTLFEYFVCRESCLFFTWIFLLR